MWKQQSAMPLGSLMHPENRTAIQEVGESDGNGEMKLLSYICSLYWRGVCPIMDLNVLIKWLVELKARILPMSVRLYSE